MKPGDILKINIYSKHINCDSIAILLRFFDDSENHHLIQIKCIKINSCGRNKDDSKCCIHRKFAKVITNPEILLEI